MFNEFYTFNNELKSNIGNVRLELRIVSKTISVSADTSDICLNSSE